MKMIKQSLVALSVMGASEWAASGADQPNVLFIAVDDLRPELACYGGPQVQTPYLDQFAAQGVQFQRAYCQVAVCGASRASLMTGILPTPQRFKSYLTRADEDVPQAPTLPETFKNAGYTTISNGKIFHHRDDSEEKSWSEPAWRPKKGSMAHLDPATTERLSKRKRGRIYELPDVPDNAYFDGQLAEKTIADLQRLKTADKPFFLACGFVRPHMPFYAPKKYWDLYDREKIEIADNRYRPKGAPKALRGSNEFRSYHLGGFDEKSEAFHRLMRHGYMASVSYVDKLIGDVLAEVERLELADDTIVVVWGDHGWHLGEHEFWGKHNTTHLATRVPLMIRIPGKKTGVSSALVETSDLFPTLCSVAGLPVPDTVQGQSFAALFNDPTQAFREVAYCRFGSGDAVITDGFTYTRYLHGKGEMLYDLEKDPDENQNVVNNPDYAETVKKMKAHLNEREAEAAAAKLEPTPKQKRTMAPKSSSSPEAKVPGYEGDVPVPTHSGVKYGPHERHVLDFWQAKSNQPTPLVLVIHGGGWSGGSKERMSRFADANALLNAGISVVAINYRLMRHAQDVTPPVKAPLHDAARALQFLRGKAKEWNIDPTRIGAAGGSAGACTSLWLAYHDDMADPDSDDPVARQSTRLTCAAVRAPQTSLDPKQMKEWTPNSRYGGHAFGKKNFAQFLAERESILPWIAEYSPFALATKDDPPVALFYGAAPAMGKPQKDPTHTANFGIGLQTRCLELGIECLVIYPGGTEAKVKTPADYLIATLKKNL